MLRSGNGTKLTQIQGALLMQRSNGTWQEEAKILLHLVPGIASFLIARRPPKILLTATGAKNFTPHLNNPFITR